MRLSEAIRLGSLAIQNPQRGNIHTCAIGMACEAIGKQCGSMNYTVLAEQWPWASAVYHRRFNNWTHPSDGIWSLFDGKVCKGEMTLDALCDQVRAWEDELESRGINVEQVTMIATPEATREPAAEHTEKVSV